MSESTTSSSSRSPLAGWLAAGVFLLVAVAAGVYGAYQRNLLADVELRLIDAVTKLQVSEERATAVQNESNSIRTNLSMLASPDTVEVRLTGKGTTPDATGRVFVSRLKGILFSATKLKPLGENDEYRWHGEMQREAEYLRSKGDLARYTVGCVFPLWVNPSLKQPLVNGSKSQAMPSKLMSPSLSLKPIR